MKKLPKIFICGLCAALLAIPVVIAGCKDPKPDTDPTDTDPPEFIDYASDLKLDMESDTIKQEVQVRLFVDGDTTHFNPVKNSALTPNVDLSVFDEVSQGYIKARYIAINTPESTGKIEKWGKTASNFTHDKLESATSIIVESDDGNWNADSTGSRFVLWVWYKPEGETEYRNLNVEILQAGLAYGSSTTMNRYGTVANAALTQAQAHKLCVFSPASTVDENYFDGDAANLSLKELRCHVDDYLGMPVRVTGTVYAYYNSTIYIQDQDPESGLYYGISIFDGYATGALVGVFSVGNEVSVYGKVTEFQGTYQMSDIKYDIFRPDAVTNSQVVSTGNDPVFTEVTASDIVNRKVSIEFYDETEGELSTVEMDYGAAIMATAVEVKNLTVIDTWTTVKGDSAGAISFTCRAEDGTVITVRTEVLYDDNGDIILAENYKNKVITVKGLIEYYDGNYQIKCYRTDYLIIQ